MFIHTSNIGVGCAAKQLGSEAAKFLDAERHRCQDAKSVSEIIFINRDDGRKLLLVGFTNPTAKLT